MLEADDAVETNSFDDLLMIQLDQDRFTYAGDDILSASPHLRWSKIVVAGVDWGYQSKLNKIISDQYLFDMGNGAAFTSTSRSVPPTTFINPKHGPNILKALIQDAPAFLRPYEDMDILDLPTEPPMPASLSIRLPDDGIDADPEDFRGAASLANAGSEALSWSPVDPITWWAESHAFLKQILN